MAALSASVLRGLGSVVRREGPGISSALQAVSSHRPLSTTALVRGPAFLGAGSAQDVGVLATSKVFTGPFAQPGRMMTSMPGSPPFSAKQVDSGSCAVLLRFGLDGKLVQDGERHVLPWGEVEQHGLSLPYGDGFEKEIPLLGGVIRRDGALLIFFELDHAIKGLVDHMKFVNKSLGNPEPDIDAKALTKLLGVTLRDLVVTYADYPHLKFRLVIGLAPNSKEFAFAGFIEKAGRGSGSGPLAKYLPIDNVATFTLNAGSGNSIAISAIRLPKQSHPKHLPE